MKTTLALLSAALCLSAPAAFAQSPYTGWAHDYTGSEPNTLLLWKFDDPNPALDSSSGGHNVVFSGTGTATDVTGKFNEAFESGPARSTSNDSYARNTSSASVFNGSAMSVEFWYQPRTDVITGAPVLAYFFDKKYASNNGISLSMLNNGSSTGALYLQLGNGSTSSSLISSDLDWDVNTWYNIAVTYENVAGNGVSNIYRDGELVGTKTTSGFGDLAPGTLWWNLANRLGSTYGSMPGYYDNFRIASKAYNYGPIPEPGSIALLAVSAISLFYLRKRNV